MMLYFRPIFALRSACCISSVCAFLCVLLCVWQWCFSLRWCLIGLSWSHHGNGIVEIIIANHFVNATRSSECHLCMWFTSQLPFCLPVMSVWLLCYRLMFYVCLCCAVFWVACWHQRYFCSSAAVLAVSRHCHVLLLRCIHLFSCMYFAAFTCIFCVYTSTFTAVCTSLYGTAQSLPLQYNTFKSNTQWLCFL